MPIDKYHLNLAGEYRVASELLKRGLLATVTYGNAKGADVIAVGSNRRAAIVEVKASNSNRFVTSFYQKFRSPDAMAPDFWVLYSVAERERGFEERFFVLSHGEMARSQAIRNQTQCLNWHERCAASVRGVDNVLGSDLTDHCDAWQKIVDYCQKEP